MNSHVYQYGARYMVRAHMTADGGEVTRITVEQDGREIVHDVPEVEDAQDIARKLAAHDDLVAALRNGINGMEILRDECAAALEPTAQAIWQKKADLARAALAKATAP